MNRSITILVIVLSIPVILSIFSGMFGGIEGFECWCSGDQSASSQKPAALAPPTWIAPTLQNNWKYFGNPWSVPGYMTDPMGFVHLRGLVSGGSIAPAGSSTGGSNTIFTLPVGARPSGALILPTVTNSDVFGEIRIGSDGSVFSCFAGNPSWLSLDGISFSTAP